MAHGSVRYFLGEADKALLDEMIADYLRRGPARRTRSARRPDEGFVQAGGQETHLFFSGPTTVPALTHGGTTGTLYTDAEDDTPGSADCEVYETVGGRPQATGIFYTVYNYSDVAVPTGRWFKATLDKYNTWLVDIIWLEFGTC